MTAIPNPPFSPDPDGSVTGSSAGTGSVETVVVPAASPPAVPAGAPLPVMSSGPPQAMPGADPSLGTELGEVDAEHSPDWSQPTIIANFGRGTGFHAAGIAGGRALAAWNDAGGHLALGLWENAEWSVLRVAERGTAEAVWLSPTGQAGMVVWDNGTERMQSHFDDGSWATPRALSEGFELDQPFPVLPDTAATVGWNALGDRAMAWTFTGNWVSTEQGWEEVQVPPPALTIEFRAVSSAGFVTLSAPRREGNGAPVISEWSPELGWRQEDGPEPTERPLSVSPSGARLLWAYKTATDGVVRALLRRDGEWETAELEPPGFTGRIASEPKTVWAGDSEDAAMWWEQCPTTASSPGGCGSEVIVAVLDGQEWQITALSESDATDRGERANLALAADGTVAYIASDFDWGLRVSRWSAPFEPGAVEHHQLGFPPIGRGELPIVLTNEDGSRALILGTSNHPETDDSVLIESSYVHPEF